MISYEVYLGESESLSFEDAKEIYNDIMSQMDLNDEDAKEIWEDYVKAAADYAATRSRWLLKSKSEKMETDDIRSAEHNLSIINLNMMARWMEKSGRSSAWRTKLGDAGWKNADYDAKAEPHRKRIGDFNCYVALIYGLNAR